MCLRNESGEIIDLLCALMIAAILEHLHKKHFHHFYNVSYMEFVPYEISRQAHLWNSHSHVCYVYVSEEIIDLLCILMMAAITELEHKYFVFIIFQLYIHGVCTL